MNRFIAMLSVGLALAACDSPTTPAVIGSSTTGGAERTVTGSGSTSSPPGVGITGGAAASTSGGGIQNTAGTTGSSSPGSDLGTTGDSSGSTGGSGPGTTTGVSPGSTVGTGTGTTTGASPGSTIGSGPGTTTGGPAATAGAGPGATTGSGTGGPGTTTGAGAGGTTGSAAASCTPGAWTVTVLDQTSVQAGQQAVVGTNANLVADSQGGLHASYLASSVNPIANGTAVRYASRSATGAWTVQNLLTDFDPGGPAIAVDAQDGVHVSFVNNGDLYYVYQAVGGSPSAPFALQQQYASTPLNPALGVDSQGDVQLLYCARDAATETSGGLAYVSGNLSAGFGLPLYLDSDAQETNGDGGILAYTSISTAVEPSGAFHAAYNSTNDVGFSYLTYLPAGTWAPTTVGSDIVSTVALAVDGSGGVHVVYFDTETPSSATTFNVKFADLPAGSSSWTFGYIESGSALYPSVAIDAQGGEHAAYRTFSEVRYAYRPAGGSWTTSTIASPGVEASIGNNEVPAIAVDGAGGVHVVYYDWYQGALMDAELCP